MADRKVIITCAITGSIHTPGMSPHLPVTVEQIADAAVGAAEAGAAIIHLHARKPETGIPDQSPDAFRPILQSVRQRCDAVLNITTGGSQVMTIDERLRPAVEFEPEIASLNMGTMNFGLYPMLARYPQLDGWERDYLEGTRNGFFRNTLGDIEHILTSCAKNATRFEVECYDIGHLYTLSHFANRGLIKPPFFIQSVFGILGGIGNDPADIFYMKQTADRLFGSDYHWSVMGAGAAQMRVAALGASLGSNVRVGLEDSLWIGKGELAESNADQVNRVRNIVEQLGQTIATPEEARSILGLKGGDRVNF